MDGSRRNVSERARVRRRRDVRVEKGQKPEEVRERQDRVRVQLDVPTWAGGGQRLDAAAPTRMVRAARPEDENRRGRQWSVLRAPKTRTVGGPHGRRRLFGSSVRSDLTNTENLSKLFRTCR